MERFGVRSLTGRANAHHTAWDKAWKIKTKERGQ
jgi:hypothetical protein